MSEKTKYALAAVVAPALFPLVLTLLRRDEQDFFWGLSSSFWAGTLLGISIGFAVLAIALFVRSGHRSEA